QQAYAEIHVFRPESAILRDARAQRCRLRCTHDGCRRDDLLRRQERDRRALRDSAERARAAQDQVEYAGRFDARLAVRETETPAANRQISRHRLAVQVGAKARVAYPVHPRCPIPSETRCTRTPQKRYATASLFLRSSQAPAPLCSAA